MHTFSLIRRCQMGHQSTHFHPQGIRVLCLPHLPQHFTVYYFLIKGICIIYIRLPVFRCILLVRLKLFSLFRNIVFPMNYLFMSLACFLLGCIFHNDLLFFLCSGYYTVVSRASVVRTRSVFGGQLAPSCTSEARLCTGSVCLLVSLVPVREALGLCMLGSPCPALGDGQTCIQRRLLACLAVFDLTESKAWSDSG